MISLIGILLRNPRNHLHIFLKDLKFIQKVNKLVKKTFISDLSIKNQKNAMSKCKQRVLNHYGKNEK